MKTLKKDTAAFLQTLVFLLSTPCHPPVPWLLVMLSPLSKVTGSAGDWNQSVVLLFIHCSLFLVLLLSCGFQHQPQSI